MRTSRSILALNHGDRPGGARLQIPALANRTVSGVYW